jgi:ribosomal protein S18 acetylase RimI-like enzyme
MVARAYRRRGVAATLMAEVTSFLRKRRVRYFTATTAVANKTAIKFYERNGMEPLQVTMAGTAHGRDRTRKSTGSYRKARE